MDIPARGMMPARFARGVAAGLFLLALGAPAACAQAPAQEAAAGVVHVSTAGEFEQAVRAMRGPGQILLAPGRYPGMMIRDVVASGEVEVASADPANPAVITGLRLRNVSGFVFRDLLFTPHQPREMARYVLLAMNAENVTFRNLQFRGADGRVDPAIGPAVMIRGSRNIEFEKNAFSHFRHGLALLNVDGIRIRFNEFNALQTDAIRGGGVHNAEIANNVMTGFAPAEGDHPDGIQLWSTHQDRPAVNIRIRDNLVFKGQGGSTQGIFIRDTHHEHPFENLEITGNLIVGSLYNGITVAGVVGARLTGNEVIAEPGRRSWIRINRGRDVVLEDNRAERFVLADNPGPIRQRNNRQIGQTNRNLDARVREWVAGRPGFDDYRGPVLTRIMGQE